MIARAVQHFRHGLVLFLLLTVLLTGVLPLVFTLLSQLLFPSAARGSLIEKDGIVIGSSLLGQEFTGNKYFWGRPSATVPAYNPSASAASHFSMNNSTLLEQANERMAHFPSDQKIPLLLITASGSGLDPEITPEAAYFQAARVAKARGMSQEKIHELIDAQTEGAHLGFIGYARVNVLALNLALDARK